MIDVIPYPMGLFGEQYGDTFPSGTGAAVRGVTIIDCTAKPDLSP
jgi:hypothetical protein